MQNRYFGAIGSLLFFLILVSGCSLFGKDEESATDDSTYRVVVAPNSDLGGRSVFPSDSDWTLTYEFTVPPLPESLNEDSSEVFYVWGDVSFDDYGSLGQYPLHSYRYNQIVPQVMIGDSLDGNDSDYVPSWNFYDTWVIQAQYYWMGGDGTSYAQVGDVIEVSPGDSLVTTIAYTASSGEIVASIAADAGTSTITIPKPFPNEESPLFDSWKDFLEQAEEESTDAYGLGVINVETHYIDEATLCSILPFEIQGMSGPGFPESSDDFYVSQEGSFSCSVDQVNLDF